MKETDLYLPVKTLFESLGYTINSEVKDIDVIAIKNDDMIIIELKTTYNLKLIIQGIKRQRISDKVYIAIPRPKSRKRFSKDFKDKEYLLRRLELGLILVTLDCKEPYAQIVFDPIPFNRKKSKARSNKVKTLALEELNNRHGDNNIGGTKGKVITAYREASLLIASYLEENDTLTTKELRNLGCSDKTTTILYQNHYNWFKRMGRGVYSLSDLGKEEINQYKHIINKLR